MGSIDSTKHTLTCKPCSIVEASTVLDKGSNYSGSWWQSGTVFQLFETEWTGGDKTEPRLVRAVCKGCGASPGVKIT